MTGDLRPSQVAVAVATAVMDDDYDLAVDAVADYVGPSMSDEAMGLIGAQAGVTLSLAHLVATMTGEPVETVMQQVGVTIAQTSERERTRDR